MELYKTPLILDSNTLQITDLIYKFHLCLEFEEEVLILNMITNLRANFKSINKIAIESLNQQQLKATEDRNKRRIPYKYSVNDQVLVKNQLASKDSFSYDGPFKIEKISKNSIMVNGKSYNFSHVKPYPKSEQDVVNN